MNSERPVFLSFVRLRFPVGAVVSIGHRISGMLLVLTLPFLVWALEHSLRSDQPLDLNGGPLVRLAFFLLAWAAAHHLFAGIRHLLSDADVGSSLPASRASAWAALIGAFAVGLAALALP